MSPVGDNSNPSATEVAKFHQKDDCDARPESHHHTLGFEGNRAMPGNALEGFSFPSVAPSSYSQAVTQTILDALQKLQGNL